ncbi:hypothetical protein QR680_002885 [Steinernema hermaphroditum]|uniref:Uncharacterized protein n=1 Tax=Steinernema hermaphroditum TaxID=289476 RepID=A0AA39H4H6_9BILA|nr:hypothetical protein QR680_002885 [Steinernema hermaphroditum]
MRSYDPAHQCLLMHNHDIDLRHRPNCVCDMCYKTANLVSANIRRLDAYRALSSEAFLCSVVTRKHVESTCPHCGRTQTQHKGIYLNQQWNVQNIAFALVLYCWNMEEVDELLQQPDGSSICDAHLPYPRVRLALVGEMRQCSNLSVQMGIENKWRAEKLWRNNFMMLGLFFCAMIA